MGNAKSTCRVVNEARHDIIVEVFSPRDVGGEFAVQRLTLRPGDQAAIPTTKKGVQLRISGNGKSQDLIHAASGAVISVRRIQQGHSAPSSRAANPTHESREQTAAVTRSLDAKEKPKRGREATDGKRGREWLDEKEKFSRDELEQLTLKLRKESRADRRAVIVHQIQKKEAEIHRREDGDEEESDTHDELSASIAALRRRNDKLGFSGTDNPKKRSPQAEMTEEEGAQSAFNVNLDPETDDLMAAIKRLTASSHGGHAKKNSWDRAPQMFAHV